MAIVLTKKIFNIHPFSSENVSWFSMHHALRCGVVDSRQRIKHLSRLLESLILSYGTPDFHAMTWFMVRKGQSAVKCFRLDMIWDVVT